MALNWKRAPWRKLYVSEEGSFALLPALTRGLAGELIKLCDDTGVIRTGGRAPAVAVAILLRAHPAERRALPRMLAELEADGYLLVEPSGDLRLRNFKPAQMRWDRVRGDHSLDDERASGEHPSDVRLSSEQQADVTRASAELHLACMPTELSRAHDSRGPAPLDPIRNDSREREDARAGDAYRRLADAVWQEQEDAKAELRADGIDPGSRGLGPTHATKGELVRRISEQAADGRGIDEAAKDCRHVLAVLVFEARRDRTLRWLNGSHWKAEAFGRVMTREVGSAFGPTSAAPAAPKPYVPGGGAPLLFDGYTASKKREAEEKARLNGGGAP